MQVAIIFKYQLIGFCNGLTRSMTVLLEAPFDKSRIQKNSVLLTIDLTKAVADEAIKNQNSVIVAYRKTHPS